MSLEDILTVSFPNSSREFWLFDVVCTDVYENRVERFLAGAAIVAYTHIHGRPF